MQALIEATIRQSFRGCSAGERTRLRVPDLTDVHWEEIDFLSWLDRSDARIGYLVYINEQRGVDGFVLRFVKAAGESLKQSMCNFCHTIHSIGGVALFTTPRWGEAGKSGGTVGDYICADLSCSDYVRGLKTPRQVQMPTTKNQPARIAELIANVELFFERVKS